MSRGLEREGRRAKARSAAAPRPVCRQQAGRAEMSADSRHEPSPHPHTQVIKLAAGLPRATVHAGARRPRGTARPHRRACHRDDAPALRTRPAAGLREAAASPTRTRRPFARPVVLTPTDRATQDPPPSSRHEPGTDPALSCGGRRVSHPRRGDHSPGLRFPARPSLVGWAPKACPQAEHPPATELGRPPRPFRSPTRGGLARHSPLPYCGRASARRARPPRARPFVNFRGRRAPPFSPRGDLARRHSPRPPSQVCRQDERRSMSARPPKLSITINQDGACDRDDGQHPRGLIRESVSELHRAAHIL